MLAELQDISKHYEHPVTGIRNVILNHVSLSIEAKGSIAIVGPSGSGKSTLLNILGTLDKPSSGQVILDGNPANTLDENQLAEVRNQFIGFVFQLHHLLPQLTLIENVLLPVLPVKSKSVRRAAAEHAYQLIERVGLVNQLHHRPGQMSVGECQRAAVVRALINRPRLLLADEPTGSLDAENAHALGQMLVELKNEYGLAVVLVTHSPDLASRMGRIYKLSSGNLHLIEPR
jgi:lipoprotein-releasing system ATP-binding protein